VLGLRLTLKVAMIPLSEKFNDVDWFAKMLAVEVPTASAVPVPFAEAYNSA
jgi:hypothetical protein